MAQSKLSIEVIAAAAAPLWLIYNSRWPNGAILTVEAYRTLFHTEGPAEVAELLPSNIAMAALRARGLPFVGSLDLTQQRGD